MRFVLVLVFITSSFAAQTPAAFAQGENPRCPDAPMRFPSGNWIWFAFNPTPEGHRGLDLVDENRATPVPGGGWPYYTFPENAIPVYAPMDGDFNNVGWLYGFPGSALLTGTLDPVWSGKVPTTAVRLWFTHMSNYAGTVSYVVRQSGPIKEGDLIGYQGQGGTAPVHVHFGVYDSTLFNPGDDRVGLLDPKWYVNAEVSYPFNRSNFMIPCSESPGGQLDWPLYNSVLCDATTVRGWVIDRAAQDGTTGIDQVEIYRDGYRGSGGASLGSAAYGLARPDVSAAYGNQFLNSGYSLNWSPRNLPAGRHGLYVYAHVTRNNLWSLLDVKFVYTLQPAITCFFRFLPFIRR